MPKINYLNIFNESKIQLIKFLFNYYFIEKLEDNLKDGLKFLNNTYFPHYKIDKNRLF